MKTFLSRVNLFECGAIGAIFGLLIAVLVSTSGCSSTAFNNVPPTPVVTSPFAQATIEGVVSGATIGVLAANHNNPELINDFATGATVLAGLSGSTNAITAAEVGGLLAQSHSTNQLVNSLIVGNVTSLATAFESSTTNAIIPVATIDDWLQWDAAGIRNGLNAVTVETAPAQ